MSDEYDAFGRKKDEAGLGDLGWGSSTDPKATTVKPAPPASPTAPVQTTLAPPTNVIRSGRNPLLYIVQFVVVLGIGLGVFLAVDGSNKAGDSLHKSIDDFVKGASGSSTKSVAGTGNGSSHSKPPHQLKPRDYFTPAGLRAGLKILAKEQPGKITNFSFRRDRIDLQVVRGGKTHIIDFPNDAEVPDDLNTSTATSLTDAFSYEEINAQAPARLMRAANARLNRSKDDVDYFVVQKWTGAMQWGIYYKGGSPIAQGDSRGRYTRQIS